ncbi:4-hydroxythreonine-4-phosphate dehydrogenase PdxA [Pseudohoeflea coraliihabitans]|uniref:4-hydroxythreonine-4-phosphate dehydrogenase n=1 Tax=Pseudohoeflea coraliihabitans TaxID=2860393 RepID=A0ABS6WS01_9HYPH|nr:4-hydroxythreonine-4-phosphate dehydrogenase PdxA [Pseudohoeflea sp. DP4N28-3]MBW3098710.1 4-hydroxythreonine-4-phosphate dehydrogenase PdxA [Pseudohoeflea sp. DP4N28-3]
MALALSMGDPAGIGPDIAIGAWLQRREADIAAFFVIGDPAVLRDRAALLDVELPLIEIEAAAAADAHFAAALPVLPVRCARPARPGQPNTDNASATIEAIRQAVRLTLTGDADGVVTAPIAKAVLYDAGFLFPGHTEFLAALAAEHLRRTVRPVMLLVNSQLKVAPVTIHIPLKEVTGQLTTEAIVETGQIIARELKARFGIAAPRLAVSGLNPHAGESGALGDEDGEIVLPAVRQLRALGVQAIGPLPADTMFHPEARASYDAAVCMYHDQALIPAKTLGFHDGVNATLGLPFIRTSPDHGTAFSLAGSGDARPDSLIAALRLAGQMAAAQSGRRVAGDA